MQGGSVSLARSEAAHPPREIGGVLAFKEGSKELDYLECTTCKGYYNRMNLDPLLSEFKDKDIFAVSHTHWEDNAFSYRPSRAGYDPDISGFVGDFSQNHNAVDYRPILRMESTRTGLIGGHPSLIIHKKGVTIYPSFQYYRGKTGRVFPINNEVPADNSFGSSIVPYSKK